MHGNPGQTNYAASKAGIIGFTKALARELAPRVARGERRRSGYITTALTEVLPEQAQQAILTNTPLERMGTPEDVAAAVRYLIRRRVLRDRRGTAGRRRAGNVT